MAVLRAPGRNRFVPGRSARRRLAPGPALFRDEIPRIYALFLALFVTNLAMVLLQYTLMIRFFTWAPRIPNSLVRIASPHLSVGFSVCSRSFRRGRG